MTSVEQGAALVDDQDLPAAGPAGQESPSRVIAVLAPRGGVGKTTIAVNLAVGLASIAPNSVVLVDGDIQFGDVATALDLAPVHTLPDIVVGPATTDAMVLKTHLTPHGAGFYVVCGAPSPEAGDEVSGEQFAHLIKQLRSIFHYVVIDTTPGLGEHALTALDLATDAVFSSSLSVSSLRAMRTELAILSTIPTGSAVHHMVVNFGDRMSGLTTRDAALTMGVPVDVVIPRSLAVPLSTNRGIPLLQTKSNDPAAKALAELVGRIARKTRVPWSFRNRSRKKVAA